MSKQKAKPATSINMMTPIGGDTLGTIGINLLRGFRDSDIDVSLFPIPIADKLFFNDQDEYDISLGAIRYNRHFDYSSPTLKIWYGHDLAIKPGSGKYFVFIVPNTNNLTSSEIHNLNFTDGIFSHCEETIALLKKHKIKKPIYKVDLGINQNIFIESTCTKTTNDPYIFYATGRWSSTNGHDIVIECFSKTFTEDDNVLLRLLPYNEFLKEEEEAKWIKLIDDSPLKNKITIYNRLNTQYDLANFIADTDCLLSLNRIAHSGLNIMEAMSMGKPIIYTDIGINNQLKDHNNYPIKISSYEPANDNRILFGESDWAYIGDSEKLEISQTMRKLFDSKIRTNPTSSEFIGQYFWANTARFMANIMFESTNKGSKIRRRKTTK